VNDAQLVKRSRALFKAICDHLDLKTSG